MRDGGGRSYLMTIHVSKPQGIVDGQPLALRIAGHERARGSWTRPVGSPGRLRIPRGRSAAAAARLVHPFSRGLRRSHGKTPRPAPKESLRLWVPYVVGDLYGSPNAGEISPTSLNPDLSFTLDLNASLPHDSLTYRFDIVLRGRRSTLFENRLEGN